MLKKFAKLVRKMIEAFGDEVKRGLPFVPVH